MPTMYDANGQPIEVADEDVKSQFLAGKAFFAQGQQVHVKNQRGQVIAIDPTKAGDAFRNGFGAASAEDVNKALERKSQNTIGKSAEALGVGAVRGLTLGLSDPLAIAAAGAFGGEEAGQATREHLKKLQEYHPIASTTGEVAGAVAPVLLSGGAAAPVEGAEVAAEGGSLLARAGRAVGTLPRLTAEAGEAAGGLASRVVGEGATSLAGRIAQRAIPGAVQAGTEGAVYGAGATISESALGDEELTAEKLLAGAGHGALLGAVTGGALGTSYELGKAAVDKGLKLAGKEGLEQWLQSVADNQTIRALGANARDIRNLGGMGRSTEKVEERVAQISDTVRNFKFENGEKLFNATSTTSKLADKLDEAVDEVGQKLGKFRAKVAEITRTSADLAPDAASYLAKLDDQIIKPAAEAGGTLAKRAKLVDEELGALRSRVAAGESVPIEDLTQARMRLDKILYPKRVPGIQAPPPEHYEQLFQARQLLEQHIEEATDKALAATGTEEMRGAYQSIKSQFKDLLDAKAMASGADQRALARNTVGLGTKIMAGSALAAGANPIGALGAGVVNHLITDRGNAMLAAAADKAATLIKMQRLAGEVDDHLSESITAFLNDHSEVRELAAKGAHVARETTKTAAEKYEEAKAPKLNEQPRMPEGYEQTVREVAAQTAQESIAQERTAQLIAPISRQAPGIAGVMAQKLSSNMQYLQQQIPPPSYPSGFPAAPQPHASTDPAKQGEFLRQVKTVQSPVQTVTTALKGNTLTHAHVAALKATAPKLADDIEKKVLSGIADMHAKGKAMGYEQRLQAGILTGQPLDPTATPQFISAVQQMHGERTKQGAKPPAAPERTIKFASSHKSFSERIGS